MKHIKKFNEAKNNKVDKEYFNNCFIELIDQGFKFNYGKDSSYMDINLNFKFDNGVVINGPNNDLGNIDKIKYFSDRIKIICEVIESSIKKLEIEYPSVKYAISINKKSILTLHIFIKDKKEEH